MSIPPSSAYDWIAAVVGPRGSVVAAAVLVTPIGVVPEAALDAHGTCLLRYPDGVTERATVIRRASGFAVVNTGYETGPRQAPIIDPVAARLSGPCAVLCLDGSGGVEVVVGAFARTDGMITAIVRPELVWAGAAVLYGDRLVAVVREKSGLNGFWIADMGELLDALNPGESPHAASKGAPSEVQQDTTGARTGYGQGAYGAGTFGGGSRHELLPYTDPTRTAYGLAAALGSTRPGGLPPTDAGVVLLGLIAAGRGPLADEAVPRALYDLLAEPRDQRLAAALARAHSSADLDTIQPVPVSDGQRVAGSEDVIRAAEASARAAGEPVVAVGELATVVVGAELDPDLLAALGVTREDLQACVAGAVRASTDRLLAGPFASDQLASGELPGDELGTKAYATMLATLIAKAGTPMPISIGLFGEWGSGKSYFMELLRREVNRLTGLGEPYLHDVVQLTFNAWHYSDTNLWASLGAEFFEQLLGPHADPVVARRDALRKDLTDNQELVQELTAAQEAAVTRAGELRDQLDAAARRRDAKAQEWDAAVLKRVVDDPELKAELTKIDKSLGLGESADRAVGLAREVAAMGSDIAAIGQVLLHRRWRGTFLAVLFAMAGLAGMLAASDQLAEWLGGGTVVAFAAAVASVGRAVKGARAALDPLRKAAARGRAVEDQMRERPRDSREAELAEALRGQEAKAAVLGAQLADTVARAAGLDRELSHLHPGRRLYRFIAERVSSADYRAQLGMVSTVRHDFEELSRLMKEEWPNRPPGDRVKPIERIVLYIDDLDRCEPPQVVAVLQAVHLLMAMDLFVVVVGVDPRWLLRSLRRQYRALLGPSVSVDGFWATTPQNYLEKIFQIPFVLPGMGPAGFDRLMRSLARPKPGATTSAAPQPVAGEPAESGAGQAGGGSSSKGKPPRGVGAAASESGVDPSRLVITAASEIATVTTTIGPGGSPARPPAPAARQLTERELAFLAHLADLVATPRAAKRLFNIYALLRSTSDVWPGSSFLGGDPSPGEFEAVAQLLAIMASRPELLGTLMWGRRADGSVESRALCRRPPPSTSWGDFITGLSPRPSVGDGWENDVADVLTSEEVAAWTQFVRLLVRVQDHVKLNTLEPYRQWAPKIARFSFVLSPFADDEPE